MAQANYFTIPIRILFPGEGKPSTGLTFREHAALNTNLLHPLHRTLSYQDAGDHENRGTLRETDDLVADAIGAIKPADGKGGRIG
jgi:hypothetical protein